MIISEFIVYKWIFILKSSINTFMYLKSCKLSSEALCLCLPVNLLFLDLASLLRLSPILCPLESSHVG